MLPMTPSSRSLRRVLSILVCGAALQVATVAQGGEAPAATYASVADLNKDLPNRAGSVLKLNPQKLTATEAKFYGCAFRDKKKWHAISLTDDKGASIIAYHARDSSDLEPEKDKDHKSNLMYAVLKAPTAKARCKVKQFELIDY